MYWLMSALLVVMAVFFGEGVLTPLMTLALVLIGPIGEKITGSDSFVTPGAFRLMRSSAAALSTTVLVSVALIALALAATVVDARRHVIEGVLAAGILVISWAWAMKFISLASNSGKASTSRASAGTTTRPS